MVDRPARGAMRLLDAGMADLDSSRIDAQSRAITTKRRLVIYLCPHCRRRVKRVKKPKRCCSVELLRLGSVMETISEKPDTQEST